ncbi:MAG: RNA-binding S4 domain-containing protein [Firmicutes bacterium]|nr:RNA-binding S4 domain-containing protein [Bacillota bacterium]
MIEVPLTGPYITLQNLLKSEGLIPTGGSAKWLLQEESVLVNGVREQRRGRKLYEGDQVNCSGQLIRVVAIASRDREE